MVSKMHDSAYRGGPKPAKDELEVILPPILMLETPEVEDIARAIWQRQRDALGPDAIARDVEWRDQSIPAKFWNEFLRDAEAVLRLLHKKHIDYHDPRPVVASPSSVLVDESDARS